MCLCDSALSHTHKPTPLRYNLSCFRNPWQKYMPLGNHSSKKEKKKKTIEKKYTNNSVHSTPGLTHHRCIRQSLSHLKTPGLFRNPEHPRMVNNTISRWHPWEIGQSGVSAEHGTCREPERNSVRFSRLWQVAKATAEGHIFLLGTAPITVKAICAEGDAIMRAESTCLGDVMVGSSPDTKRWWQTVNE